MDDIDKRRVAKSVIKIAKRDDIDKFVTYEDTLMCKVSKENKVDFFIDQKMYFAYMNVINKAFYNGKPTHPELDSKLQEDFDSKYGEEVVLDHNFTVSPLVVIQNFHLMCKPSGSLIRVKQYFQNYEIDT